MTTYNNKALLLIGGTRLINEAVVRHFLEQGVGRVRAYSGDEEGLTALRDRLQVADAVFMQHKEWFVEPMHLNREGARQFSNRITDRIPKLLIAN